MKKLVIMKNSGFGNRSATLIHTQRGYHGTATFVRPKFLTIGSMKHFHSTYTCCELISFVQAVRNTTERYKYFHGIPSELMYECRPVFKRRKGISWMGLFERFCAIMGLRKSVFWLQPASALLRFADLAVARFRRSIPVFGGEGTQT